MPLVTKKLGSSGVDVSAVCLGTMTFGCDCLAQGSHLSAEGVRALLMRVFSRSHRVARIAIVVHSHTP